MTPVICRMATACPKKCPLLCGMVSRAARGGLSYASWLQVHMKALYVPVLKACSQIRGHWHIKAIHVLHLKPNKIGDIFLRQAVYIRVTG